LIFDDAGHLLVPLYLEKETVGDGVRASVGDGPVLIATFVASDKQTNLTVLKLPANAGKPVKLSAKRPMDGAMVMLLAPNSDSAKLMLWTGGQRDIAGVVVGVDGAVAGFARYGQFLSAGACKPVVEQLVATGKVKRAMLGVTVREVQRGDPAREQSAALGNQPALRVEEVLPRSAAALADLHRDDLILTVDGEPVGDPASFAAAIANRSGKTPMRVLRAGNRVDVTVELLAE
jgi:S1-C subfamily serine protease